MIFTLFKKTGQEYNLSRVVGYHVPGNNFMYFDINKIPESFAEDFPNALFDTDDKTISSFSDEKKE